MKAMINPKDSHKGLTYWINCGKNKKIKIKNKIGVLIVKKNFKMSNIKIMKNLNLIKFSNFQLIKIFNKNV